MAAPDDPNADAIQFLSHLTVRRVINAEDPRADSDGDSISDVDEKELGTDPNNTDTDGDGMSDWDELSVNSNPLVDETATVEASRAAALDIMTEPYLNDARQGDLAAARKVAEMYGTKMTAAEEQQFQATGGAPLLNMERQRELLGDLDGPTDPRELARAQQAIDNYKKALGGDPQAYVDLQTQLTGQAPTDHEVATFIRGGGIPVLQVERQFQLLGSETERPQEHIARLQALQAQMGKALEGDAHALDVVGASLGLDKGDLTMANLPKAVEMLQAVANPTSFTPGVAVLPGVSRPGATQAGGGTGGTEGGAGGSGAGTGNDNAGVDRGRPIEVGVQRGGTGDAAVPGQGATPGQGGTPAPASEPPAPAPAPAQDDNPLAGGSRGDGGGSSLPGPIGPLVTKAGGSDPAPSAGAPGHGVAEDTHTGTRATGGGADGPGGNFVPVMNSTDTDILHFERDNGDGTTTVMTADGKELQTVPTNQLHHEAASTDDGTNDAAGTTDDDSDNEPPADDTADDSADDIPTSDDSSDTATAYVNPDADPGGGWSLGDTGGRAFVAGGGFTDGGRDDLGSLDLSGVTISDRRDLYAQIDPDADSSGGGLSEVPIVGGGFTDVVRPELAQIDLTGLTPRNPHDGTNAFGVGGDEALGTDTGDGSPDGAGPYAPGVAGGDTSAFTAGFDSMSISLDDTAFSLDATSFQLDDFSAQTVGMDALAAPGGDQMGDPDGDGLPFP
jgi:hypothetical protein